MSRYFYYRAKAFDYGVMQRVWGKPAAIIGVFFTRRTAHRMTAALNAAYEDGVCGDHTHWAPSERPKRR